MIAMLCRNLVLTAFLCLLGLAVLEQFNPSPPPMLVAGDSRR